MLVVVVVVIYVEIYVIVLCVASNHSVVCRDLTSHRNCDRKGMVL